MGIMQLIDAHCHIHDPQYKFDVPAVLASAKAAGVTKMICVGTNVENSKQAVKFAAKHDDVFAAIGIYPHEKGDVRELETILSLAPATATSGRSASPPSRVSSLKTRRNSDSPEIAVAGANKQAASELSSSGNTPLGVGANLPREDSSEVAACNKIVAFGDIGLDYHYYPYSKKEQIAKLEQQLDLAQKYDLPVSFHVRDAFDDFWPVLASFPRVRGVVHSFSDNLVNLDKALSRGLYIGLNGIVTYRLTADQAEVYAKVPLESMILETDSPYLTPASERGKINQPAYVKLVADWVALARDLAPEKVAKITTKNAENLFGI